MAFEDTHPEDDRIRAAAEDAPRLFALFQDVLGGERVWDTSLHASLSMLRRGFQNLAARFPAAADWADGLTAVLEARPSAPGISPKGLHPLAALLARQPAFGNRQEVAACQSAAALAVHALSRGATLSQAFVDGMTQFFESRQPHWEACRRRFGSSGNTLLEPLEGDREVIQSFARNIQALESAGIYAPVLHSLADSQVALSALEQPEDSSQPEPPREPTCFSEAPNFHLFEFQTVQQEREPSLTQFRLLNDWNSLMPGEFEEVNAELVRQLRGDNRQERLHAAARCLSMLAQLSLEILSSAPFATTKNMKDGVQRGTLHIDLDHGILRRDFLCVAPRSDRQRRRCAGRYLRTPIPPEIVAALRHEHAQHPQARCIGDLLVNAGLTPTLCHDLVNRARTEPRAFESLRVGRSLRNFFLRKQLHPAVVSHVLGDMTVVPRAQQYYLRIDQKLVYDAVNLWCSHVGLEPVPERRGYRTLGSPNWISQERLTLAVRDLQQLVKQARGSISNHSSVEDLVEFHNLYVAAVSMQTLWGVGGRCQNLSSVTCGSLLAHPGLMLLADRASDRYSEWRVCVVSEVQQQTLLAYSEHLRTMAGRLARKGEAQAAAALHAIGTSPMAAVGALPILWRTPEGELRPRAPTRHDLKKIALRVGISELNQPRHFLASRLVAENVEALAIDAQLGHHLPAAAAFGIGSGLTLHALRAYLGPVLNELHRELGLEPLIGLHRLQKERWTLPVVTLESTLELPRSTHLRQSVECIDFNPPDIILAEQDCPWTEDTLAAASEMSRLRARYLATATVHRFVAGAVLFSLVAFDGVASEHKLQAAWNAVRSGDTHRVGRLGALEGVDDAGRLAWQVLLHQFTLDAIGELGAQQVRCDWAEALGQLQQLLLEIGGAGAGTAEAALRMVLALAAHTLHVETAPLARFGLIHKAPFISVADLRRIEGGEPGHVVEVPTNSLPRHFVRRRSSADNPLLKVLQFWADRDQQLGERKKRNAGALRHLESLASAQQEVDSLEHQGPDDLGAQMQLRMVRAELANPPMPWRRLGFGTLAKYLSLQQRFFEWVRVHDRVPLEMDEWIAALKGLAAPSRQKKEGSEPESEEAMSRRSAREHLVAWLRREGHAVPKQFCSGEKLPSPVYRPHLHVYVTPAEISAAQRVALHGHGVPRDWLDLEIRMRRRIPFRPEEIRHLKWSHHSKTGEWALVTSSGHNHLKTAYSRGLVGVPSELRGELAAHMRRRVEAREVRRAKAFVPGGESGHDAYDDAQLGMRDALRRVTSRPALRLYDLRACAVTDLIANPVVLLEHLTLATPLEQGGQVAELHARGAVAAREARHANILTTLRYYHLAGLLEARCQMNAALGSLEPGAAYLAAVHHVSRDVIYAAKCRGTLARRRVTPAMPAHPLPDVVKRVSTSATQVASHQPGPPAIHAGLLMLASVPVLAAADRAGIRHEMLEDIKAVVERTPTAERVHSSLGASGSPWSASLPALAAWAYGHRQDLDGLLNGRGGLLRLNTNRISVRNMDAVERWPILWSHLAAAGFQPVFSRGDTFLGIEERTALSQRLRDSPVEIADRTVARERFGTLSFIPSFRREGPQSGISPQVLGRSRQLVVQAIRLALAVFERSVLK